MSPNAASSSHWWRSAVIYQIYVRSFADSNGDGEGDLPGITHRLESLRDLGVDAVWLTPFYPSPLADGGYDVADYRGVDPRFGTLEDIDALIAKAHELGLKLIVDIVPNHTSDEHRWFQEALAAGPGSAARDRYVFRDGKGPNGDQPPSDWRSVFGGSGWERVPDGQWYLHLFDVKQPDLNWDNPDVRAEFEDILAFWLDRGVDGFRIDVAHGLVKDLSDPLRNIGDGENEEKLLSAVGGHDHPYWDRDGVHEVYRGWQRVLSQYEPPRMAVAEAWVDSPTRRGLYIRPDELQQAFNFDFLRSPWDVTGFHDVIEDSLAATAAVGATTTWVLSNHDVVRHVSRYAIPADTDEDAWLMSDGQEPKPDLEQGERRARAAALLMLALPGSAYVYQGEELGLREVAELPHSVLQDPVWDRTKHERKGRDGCRVPLPWDGSKSADGGSSYGFGPGGSWLPQPDDWSERAREVEAADPGSMLRLYQDAMVIRRELGGDGVLEWLPEVDATVALGFRRQTGLVCVVNFGEAPLDLPQGEVLLASGDLEGGKLPTDTAVWLRS